MVGATNDELYDAARDSIFFNRCEMVVANEWWKLKGGNHEVMIVEAADDYLSALPNTTTCTIYNEDQAKRVMEHAVKMRNTPLKSRES